MGWEGVGGRCCSWSLGQLGRGRGEGVRGQGLPPGRTAPALPAGRGYLVCCCPWATRFAIWGRRAWKGRVALPAPRSQELCVGCLRALPPGQWPPIWELSGWAPGFPRLQSQLPRCWGGGHPAASGLALAWEGAGTIVRGTMHLEVGETGRWGSAEEALPRPSAFESVWFLGSRTVPIESKYSSPGRPWPRVGVWPRTLGVPPRSCVSPV